VDNLQRWLETNPLVKKAYEFAKEAHAGQQRVSGEPYFDHCLKTAQKVADWGLDEATVASALLHDVLRYTPTDTDRLIKEFNDEIVFMVIAINQLKNVEYKDQETDIENIRRLILAIGKDIRVVLVKLANKFHNMQTLAVLPPEKQKRIARGTFNVYAPIAYRLGMFQLAGELEDLAFPYLYPKEHQWLIEHIRTHYEDREQYAQKIKPLIKDELVKNSVELTRIDSRAKRYASLYRKLLEHEMDLEKIYDLVAIRCIVPTIEDCYSALGIIHKTWPPIPKRIKDYIASPKLNGYQSLHTTIFGPEEKMIEIQIRTQEMDDKAENGVAAYWTYRPQVGSPENPVQHISYVEKSELSWIQKLRNWPKVLMTSQKGDLPKSFKIDFLVDRVLILTPKGKVIDLPKGATVVDFAYEVHTDIGNSCIDCKINNKKMSLATELNSGDVVEIITRKNKGPAADWLEFVKTRNAKGHIREYLRRQQLKLKKNQS